MVTLDLRTLTVPLGIVRILELVLTCITFSLVASVAHFTLAFWTWCMFVWCFCFCVTFLILVLEFLSLGNKLPISWDDFTAGFAMLATLLVLSASIMFSVYFTSTHFPKFVAASVTSCLAFILYAVEVWLLRANQEEKSSFLSTVPGLLKVVEAFVACIIFTCLDRHHYSRFAGLQWCVAVYSICFIFALVVIVFTICRLLALFPAPFDKVLTCCNMLAVLMYITAVVIWPYYSFKNNPRPAICSNSHVCFWDNYAVIAFMTCFNLIAYIVDTVYSFRLVFFVSTT